MQSSLFLVGKLVHQQEDVRTLPAGPSTSTPLIYLQDSLSSRRFLINSGASVSVFPAPRSSSSPSGVKLLTADGSSLSCLGSRVIPLQFGNHRFELSFQLAPVAIPILGADFLKHYNLLLDVSNQRVFSTDSPTSPSIVLPTSPDFKSAPLKANLLATRAGHVPTFLKSFRSVLERGPSDKSFRSRSSFFYRSVLVPFCSVLSTRTVFPFRSVLGVLI